MTFINPILKDEWSLAMSDAPSTAIPAGWYPDPAGSFQQRWWTGTSWTNDFAQYRPTLIHAAPAQPVAPVAAQPVTQQETSLYLAQQAAAQVSAHTVTAQANGARTIGSQAIGGTPAYGSTSTLLTREPEQGIAAAPAAPFTLPAADQAPQTTVAQPNAGSATLIPIARSSGYAVASENPTFTNDYLPFSNIPSVRRGAREKPQRRYTGSAWALALSPLLLAGAAYALARFASMYYTVFVLGLLAVAFAIVGLLLAVSDRRGLYQDGHDSTAPSALALLTPPVYLLARAVVASRETGRSTVAPLVLSVLVLGALGAAVVLVPGVLALLTSATSL